MRFQNSFILDCNSKRGIKRRLRLPITFKEFERLDLRVGKVMHSERIEGSKKLFRLKVDLGSSQNQIVAGGGETYDPEYFMNKNFIVLTNLEPKVIAG